MKKISNNNLPKFYKKFISSLTEHVDNIELNNLNIEKNFVSLDKKIKSIIPSFENNIQLSDLNNILCKYRNYNLTTKKLFSICYYYNQYVFENIVKSENFQMFIDKISSEHAIEDKKIIYDIIIRFLSSKKYLHFWNGYWKILSTDNSIKIIDKEDHEMLLYYIKRYNKCKINK